MTAKTEEHLQVHTTLINNKKHGHLVSSETKTKSTNNNLFKCVGILFAAINQNRI